MSIDSFKLSYSDESGAHDLFFQKKEAAPSEDCITIGNTSYTVLSPHRDILSAKQVFDSLQAHGPYSSLDEVKQNLSQRGITHITSSDQIEPSAVGKIVTVLSKTFEKASSLDVTCAIVLAKQADLETVRPPLPQVFNADTIGEIINDITGSLFSHYPSFPVVVKWIEHLRENLEVYKKCKDPDEFKEKVNKDLYAIFQDKHLRLRFQTVSEAKEADNYTMTSGILPNTDHVGLIHLRGFGPVKIGADQATVEEEEKLEPKNITIQSKN